jgi:hypothetical protein
MTVANNLLILCVVHRWPQQQIVTFDLTLSYDTFKWAEHFLSTPHEEQTCSDQDWVHESLICSDGRALPQQYLPDECESL